MDSDVTIAKSAGDLRVEILVLAVVVVGYLRVFIYSGMVDDEIKRVVSKLPHHMSIAVHHTSILFLSSIAALTFR